MRLISPQKYAPERITQSFIKFNNFDYKSQFKLEDNTENAYFEEVFKYKDGNIRKNRHKLYMTPQQEILSTAKDIGFSYVNKVNMVGFAKCKAKIKLSGKKLGELVEGPACVHVVSKPQLLGHRWGRARSIGAAGPFCQIGARAGSGWK